MILVNLSALSTYFRQFLDRQQFVELGSRFELRFTCLWSFPQHFLFASFVQKQNLLDLALSIRVQKIIAIWLENSGQISEVTTKSANSSFFCISNLKWLHCLNGWGTSGAEKLFPAPFRRITQEASGRSYSAISHVTILSPPLSFPVALLHRLTSLCLLCSNSAGGIGWIEASLLENRRIDWDISLI